VLRALFLEGVVGTVSTYRKEGEGKGGCLGKMCMYDELGRIEANRCG
jgi:hypothetical protein